MTPLLGQRQRAERGFERLYDRHVGDVYRYTLALLRNPADAEDVTQTTFLNAYRAYRAGERPESARAWLIAIAHNVCRQRFRTAQRRVQEVAFEETLAESVVPDPEGPSAADIQRALGQLAFNQRAALVMRELEGRSYAEIAELLDLSTSAVETLLFRARRALREQLEGAISCDEAEASISRQLDRRLSRAERGALRAHLRACPDCAALARKQRAQRSAIKALGFLPLPSSLAVWGGGAAATTGAVAGGSVALKAAAVVATATVAVGVGHEVAQRAPERAAPAPREVAGAEQPAAVAVTPIARVLRPAPTIAVRLAPEARGGVAPEARGGVAPEARGGVAPGARGRVAPEASRTTSRGRSSSAPGHLKTSGWPKTSGRPSARPKSPGRARKAAAKPAVPARTVAKPKQARAKPTVPHGRAKPKHARAKAKPARTTKRATPEGKAGGAPGSAADEPDGSGDDNAGNGRSKAIELPLPDATSPVLSPLPMPAG